MLVDVLSYTYNGVTAIPPPDRFFILKTTKISQILTNVTKHSSFFVKRLDSKGGGRCKI